MAAPSCAIKRSDKCLALCFHDGVVTTTGVFPPGSGRDRFQRESQRTGLALLGLQALIFVVFRGLI